MSSLLKIFVPDEENVWLSAEITSIDSNQIHVTITDDSYDHKTNKSRVIDATSFSSLGINGLSSLPLQNVQISEQGVDDMCSLGYLSEASILDNLKRRFNHCLPYTYTGNVCIAMNPYQWLHSIYSDHNKSKYLIHSKNELKPHLYAISAHAYKELTDYHKNQSILVSGESGAGKTESVKILMSHLADIASNDSNQSSNSIISKVLDANPLLESFGNAKTIRNDNSSRFGKFVQLEFDNHDKLSGSRIVTYLLEKSRVIMQTSTSERNYHVLYQLLSAPSDVAKRLHLHDKDSTYFNYTSHGDTVTTSIEGVSDRDKYLETIKILNQLGIRGCLVRWLEQILAGILHLGQITFVTRLSSSFKSQQDERSREEVIDVAQDCVQDYVACCDLLGVSPASLIQGLTSRSIVIEGKSMEIPLTIEQSLNNRDAIAKEIYYQLFQYLVNVINFNTKTIAIQVSPGKAKQYAHYSEPRTISLLDIFGFESFQINKFEQLAINYANEKLQNKFTQDVFISVQNEYKNEGLAWEAISYTDNSTTLDLIEGKRGILSYLNEECMLPRGSDLSFLNKLKTANQNKPNSRFHVNLLTKHEFSVHHYAGHVSYLVSGFLDTNKDYVSDNLCDLLSCSSNPLLLHVFSSLDDENDRENDSKRSQDASKSSLLLDYDEKYDENCSGLFHDLKIMKTDAKSSDNKENSSTSSNITRYSSSPVNKLNKNQLKSLTPVQRRKQTNYISSETVITKFKHQLSRLMETLSKTQVQYIRCVKPNSQKSSSEFNRRMIVQQLRSAGVIEAITISRAAYPNRLTHREFLTRFKVLKALEFSSREDSRQCKDLLDSIFDENNRFHAITSSLNNSKDSLYEVGNSRVYFASGVLESLETMRSHRLDVLVTALQSTYRRYSHQTRYLVLRTSCIRIQARIRRYQATRRFQVMRRCAVMVQRAARRIQARTRSLHMKRVKAVLLLQCQYRMRIKRDLYRVFIRSIRLIQSVFHTVLTRRRYLIMRDKARSDRELRNQLLHTQEKLVYQTKRSEVLEDELTKLRQAYATLSKQHEDLQSRDQTLIQTNHQESQHLDGLKPMIYVCNSQSTQAITVTQERQVNIDRDVSASSSRSIFSCEKPSEFVVLSRQQVLDKLQGFPASESFLNKNNSDDDGLDAAIYVLSASHESQLVSIRLRKSFDKLGNIVIQCLLPLNVVNEDDETHDNARTDSSIKLRFRVKDVTAISFHKDLTNNSSIYHALKLFVEGKGELEIIFKDVSVCDHFIDVLQDFKRQESLTHGLSVNPITVDRYSRDVVVDVDEVKDLEIVNENAELHDEHSRFSTSSVDDFSDDLDDDTFTWKSVPTPCR